MSGVLEAIVAEKRRELQALHEQPCDARVPEGPRGHVASTLRRAAGEPLRLIAENKRKSPSAGELSTALSAAERAVAYAEAGAAMVSILCDRTFFGGSWGDVVAARNALVAKGHPTPVLAKEFVIDERQLREAAACGADAVLLIARILDEARLAKLFAEATALGLEPLVEVVSVEEVAWAKSAGAVIIGVNARNLDTLVMDTDHAARVLSAIPNEAISLHLSGLKVPADVERIASSRAHGALVGETLMRQDDPRPLLRSLVAASTREI